MKKRSLALLMAVVMLFAVTTAGTLAWIMAESEEVVNTFTFGDIKIDLNETDNEDADTSTKSNAYDLIPGDIAIKDPKVTVKANSENCYVFVTVKESNNFYEGDIEKNIPALTNRIIDFDVNTTNWKLVTAEDGADVYVYGMPTKVEYSSQDKVLESILLNDSISVNSNLTKQQIEDIKADNTLPKLEFAAYAIQAENLGEADTAAEIWALINP